MAQGFWVLVGCLRVATMGLPMLDGMFEVFVGLRGCPEALWPRTRSPKDHAI